MNKIHNVIWSTAQNAWVVVAEGTKRSSKSGAKALTVMIALILLAPAGASAATLPQGGVISVGEGSIVNNGGNQLVIKQTSEKLGVNWQSFNVGPDGQVIFDQPGKHSIAMNRVVGSDGSAILGKIDANGQVFLINPNGVIFGKDAQVNVGGLVASTLDISDEDFKSGNYKFNAGTTSGEVVNLGSLQAAEGGYVALLGKTVKNTGVIRAKLGNATLAAGSAMTLDFSGDGLISVQVDKGAVQALVDNKGLIQADGGNVLMTARASNALLETVVNNEGIVQAQTIENRSGKIFLDGGLDTGSVIVAGTLDASAPVTGNGGFIETSGAHVKVADGAKVTTLSKNGKTGDWLVDPTDFNIVAGGGAQTASQIGATTLQNNLALTNVTLQTAASGTENGDINVNADVMWASNTTLTLDAHGDINVNKNMNVLGDSGGLSFKYGSNGSNTTKLVKVATGAKVNLTGPSATYAENGVSFKVLRTAADIANLSTTGVNKSYVLGVDIDVADSVNWNAGLGYTPLGNNTTRFTGGFQGLNHTISNIYINRPSSDHNGLLGYTSNSKISNINVSGTVVGYNQNGLLVGYASNSALYNVSAIGSVSGNQATGGVLGYSSNSSLNFGRSNVTVSGTASATGGLIGHLNNGSVSNSFSTGKVQSTSVWSGGLLGYSIAAAITNVYSTGDVAGADRSGGLLGVDNSSTITNAYATGNVTGNNYLGGLVGSGIGPSVYRNVFATGSVSGNDYIGGLLGNPAGTNTQHAYSTGKVTGSLYTGGLIGYNNASYYNFTYTTSQVGTNNNAVADSSSGAENYGLASSQGKKYSGKYISKEQMMSAATFSSWDLSNQGGDGKNWRIYEGQTAPLLRSFMNSATATVQDVTVGYNGSYFDKNEPLISYSLLDNSKLFFKTNGDIFKSFTSNGAAVRNAGTYALDGLYSSQFGYDIVTPVQANIIVTKAHLNINAIASTRAYDGTVDASLTFSDDRFGSDDLTVTGSGSFTNKNAGVGKNVNVNGITVLGADAGNYSWDTPAAITGDISKRALSVTATGINKTYDGNTNAQVDFIDNRVASDRIDIYSSNKYFSDKNVGAGKTINVAEISVYGVDVNNYTWNYSTIATADISKAVLTVTAIGVNKGYDSLLSGDASFIDNRFGADDLAFSASDISFADKNAGIGKAMTVNGINVTGAHAGNYTWNTTAYTTANIGKYNLYLSAEGVHKTYDGNNTAQVNFSAFRFAGDVLSFSGTSSYADKNAGMDKSVTVNGINVTGADAGNYTWSTSVSTTANIYQAALLVTGTAANKTYDGTTAASVTLSDNRFGSDDLVVSATNKKFTNKNVGTGKTVSTTGINVTGADAGNYTWNTFFKKTADITKAALSVTATGINKTYDGTNSAGATLADNRFGSDVLTVAASGKTFADKNAGIGKVVSVSGISVTGTDAGNYTWNTTASTTADIAKAALAVTATGVNKVYDGTTTAGGTLNNNKIGADSLVVSAATKTFSNKNVGNGKTVSITGINVTGADAGNYTWNTTASTTANITKASLLVTASGVNKTYDGTTTAGATLNDNRIGADSLVVSATTKNFSNKNVGTGKTVSISGISVTGTDSGNYTWNTTSSTTADIAKAALSVTATGVNKTYDGTTTAGATLNDNRIGADSLTISAGGKDFSDKNAGTGKVVTVSGINVTGTDAGNYTWNTSATTSANITKAALAVTATGVNKTYDGTTTAGATYSDNRIGADSLAITAGAKNFSDKNAGTGKVVSVSGISVTGTDSGNYTWNTTATTSANIAKAALSVTATGVNKNYNGTTTAGATFSDNRLGSDSLVISASTKNFSDKNAGTGKTVSISGINVTGADSANYTWNTTASTTANIAKAALNITATGSNKTYDTTSTASVNLADNRIGSDVLVISAANKNFSDKNAGWGKAVDVSGITVTGADAANYTWNTSAAATADITKANLNITATGINKTYDGTDAGAIILTDDRLGSDDLSLTGMAFFSDKDAGLGKTITVGGINATGADADNYSWSSTTTATADIAKAMLNVSANGQNKTYDGSTSASVTLSDNRFGADELTITKGSQAFTDKNAGAGKVINVSGISVTGTDAKNYVWNTTAATTANIAKASLAVTANGQNKTYDGTTAASVTLSDNRVLGDILTVAPGSSAFSNKNAGIGKVVTVSGIAVTDTDSQNYNWNATATTSANIAKAALIVSAAAQNKTYDGTNAAVVSFSDNRVTADVLAVSGNSAFSDKNAGTAKTVSVSGINVTGVDASNYSWNTTATTTADITKAALNVTASGVNKTYDGTAAAIANLADDRIGGDVLVVSATGSNFSDKNAGAAKSISVAGITVGGADAGNYTWNTSTTTSADIAKAALSVTANGINKTYDGTTDAAATLADDRIGADDLVLSSTGKNFSDKNAGVGKTITVNGINVTGADAGNYTWNTTASTSADIAKAALNVTAIGIDKTYDGSTAAGATLLDNRFASDDLALTGNNSFSDKNAGLGKTITVDGINVTGADAGNYTWNTTALASANIAKAALAISSTGVNKTYDSTQNADVIFGDDRIGSDQLVVSSVANTFADKNAGLGKAVTVSGINVTGADAGNYTWSNSGSTTADIAKAALTVSAAGIGKTYDGSTDAGANLSDNRIGSDSLAVAAGSKSFADKNAGTGKTITVNGITVTGVDADNYTWNTSATTAADIAKAALTVSSSGVNKTYDGTNVADANLTDDRISGDSLTLSHSGKTFSDKNAGIGKTITVDGISVAGVDAANYTWNTTAATTADIAKAALSVTASGINKTYDGTVSAGALLADNRIGSDVLAVSASGKTFSDKNAGVGKTITVSGIDVTGADAGNYTWNTSTATTADIAKAALSVTAIGINKTYDGTTVADANLSDNRIGADDLVLSATGKSFSDKNAGIEKTLNISGISVAGTDAGNYTWNTSTSTMADIAKAALTVTAAGVGKTYDGTTGAQANLSDNRIGSDDLVLSSATKSFADKNAGIGKTVTVSGISVTGADADNYTWNDTALTSADVAKAALNITANGVNKTYDGSASANVSFGDNRIGADDLTISAGSKAFADKNAGSGKTINVSGINASGADAGNYTWNTSAVTAADIAKAALNVTASGINKTYDGTTAATVSLNDDRIAADTLVISAGSNEFADKNAGTGKLISVNGISVTGADAGNYTWNTSALTSADIAKAALNVSATGINKTYDGTASAGATLSDDRIGSDDLVLGAGSKSFADKNAGLGKSITVNGITVTGADAGNYTWNTATVTSADIAKAALNVTANGVNKTYDGTTSASVSLNDDRIGSDALVINAGSNVFADKNASTAKSITVSGINVTGADADNYTWNTSALTSADIAKAALNITASGVNKTYDGTTAAGSSLSNNHIGTDDVVVTSAGSSFSDKNAGNGKIVNVGGINVTGADAGNYTWNTSSITTADISKAALTISAAGVNKTYDGTTAAGAALSDDRIGADSLVIGSATKNFSDKNAGAGKVITVDGINVTGADSGNYTWNTSAVTAADITKAALNVSATGVNKTYDGTTAASISLSDNRIELDTLVVSSGAEAFSDKNAGTGKTVTVNGINVTGADAGNYTWNTSTVTAADISKAALNVTATGVNKTYDGTTNAGAILTDDRIGSDALVLSSTARNFTDKNAGLGKNITVAGINVTGADAGNYSWNTSAATSADIAKAALLVSAAGGNKTYDGTTAADAILTDNRIGADDVTLSSTGKAFSDKNVGLGKTVTVNGINVTGADAGNYTWNTSALTTADISKASLTITAAGVDKTYDGTTSANANLGDNRFGMDDLVVSAAGKAFLDKNAGAGKTITVSGISVTGADAGNYTWNTSALSSADINKAALTVSATGVNKTYDGTTGAGATLSDNRIGSDDLVLSAVDKSFADKNAGLGKAITVNGINVTGADASNYTWNASTVTMGDVAKAALTVTAAGVNKTYDGTTSAGATLADDRIGSDVLVLSAGSQNFSDKNAGAGKAVTASGINVTGADAGNYTWNATATTTADIAKAALNVTASGIGKTYDGTANAGATLNDDRIGSDVLLVSAAGKTFADKNAGLGKAITVNGINVTGDDAANYTWNTTALTTGDIAKAALNVTAAGVNKTYDGSTNAGANLFDDRIAGDSLALNATAKNFADKNAGSGKMISVTGITASGVDAGNYTWNASTTTSADIAKAALNVSASGISKTYDASTAAGVNLADDRIGSDNLLVSASDKNFSDKNAGLGKVVTVNGITVTGTDAGNYTWNTSAFTTADIAKAALNVIATGVSKTYDGTTTANATLSDDRIGSDSLVVNSAGKAFADKNAGLGKTITVGGINVTGADAANYSWNTTALTTGDIAKAALNVTATGVNKTYDGTTAAGANLADDRIGGDNLALNASGKNFSDKNAGASKSILVNGISVTGADADNYTWNASTLTSADISKAALNVTATGVNKTYDGNNSASVNLADDRIGSDVLFLAAADKSFSDKNAAIAKTVNVNGIDVTGTDAGNYTWNSSTVTTADIAKAALTVTAVGVNKGYDGTANAGASLSDDRIGSDNLVVSSTAKAFSDKNAGIGKAVTVSGINVTGADSGNYTWNTSAVTSADIAKAALTVTASGVNKTYDGTAAAGANLSDNRIGSDVLVLTAADKAFSDKNAGLTKTITVNGITVTGADAGNYTWNTAAVTTADIAKAALQVTASGVSKTYDGTTSATAALSDDRIGADLLVLSATGKTFSDKNAGVGKDITVNGINVTGADAGNYTWNTTAVTKADIAKAGLIVSATGVNKTYDGNTAAGAILSDDRIGADDLVLTAAGKTFSDKNAGAGKVINVNGISVSGVDAGNYTWNTSAVTSADIAKAALNVTAIGANKTYDGTTNAGASLSDDRIGSDNLVLTAAGKTFSDKNAGTGKLISVSGINVTGADADNYTWNTAAVTSADIAKAALNVTASGVGKTYDGTTAASINLNDDRLGSDALLVSVGSKAFDDKNAGSNKAISVSGISVTGADAGNYSWNTATVATADIAKAALNVTATGANKTYDGTTGVTVNLSANAIGSDVLVLNSASKAFDDKNAGAGKGITVNGINVTGTDAGNYTWNSTAVTAADIAKAALNVSAVGASKTYDGSTNAGANLTDDRIGSDVLVLAAAGKTFADKNAGLGKTVTVNGINVTGTDAGNYTWNTTAYTSADIAKAALNVSAAGANKTYDGTVEAGASLSDDRIGSDLLVVSAGGKTFTDKNAGLGKTITVNGINVTGADAANYTWNTTANTTGDIAKAALSVTATGVNKTYDGTTAASANLFDDRIGGDSLAINATGKGFSDKNAGTGKTISITGITVVGADANNYTWNDSATTFADIAKAGLNVSANGISKTYDGTTNAGVGFTDNRYGLDDLVVSAASQSFADKNVGTGKTINVGGINVTGADAGNYTWNTAAQTSANISKAALSITATGSSKTYDGTTGASSSLSNNRFGSDDIVVSSASSAFADKNAGSGKVINVGGITVSGADAGNYTWDTSITTLGDIAKANLSVGAAGFGKTYDGATSAALSFTDNRVAGDSLTVSGLGAFADKNAGIGKQINVSGITVTGADSGNYTWNTNTSAIADIAKAMLSVSAIGINKTYDGTTAAGVNFSDNRAISDTIFVDAGSSTFLDRSAGTGKAISVSGINVTGADASNYTWNTSTSAIADIARASLIVKAQNGSKVEGAVDDQLNWSLQGGKLFNEDTIQGALSRASGENAGEYAIQNGDLSAGSNYDLSVVPGTFTISSAKPPVLPPVIPPVLPPVVVEPSKPVVNQELEQTKEIISNISVASKVTGTTAMLGALSQAEPGALVSDYRLINLGMKLPDDMLSTDGEAESF